MKLRLLSLLCAVLLIICGCGSGLRFDFKDVQSVEITTADARVKVTDAEAVARLTEQVGGLDYNKVELSFEEADLGYVYDTYYTLTWYNSDGVAIESIEIVEENGYQIAHDGVVYTVDDDLAVDVDMIGELVLTK